MECRGGGRTNGMTAFSSRGTLVDFFKSFSKGGQRWWNLVFTTHNYEKSLFCRNLQIPAPFPHPCLCAGKVRASPSNNWCNFKRLNTILNSEIFLNLIRKMKCFTDELQFCFCFCIGNTNQLHLFLHWQQIGIITDNLLVAAYALSCLCIQVSNAVQNDYSVMLLLCSRCGKVWFWMCLRQVSMLCHFCLFFKLRSRFCF